MTAVQNLRFPAPADAQTLPARRREAGTYTTTDSAVVAYQKRHGSADTRVLTTLAERHNFTHRAALTVAELQVETELGQRAVEKALKVLEGAGFCHREGRTWRYGQAPANVRANGNANEKANDCTHKRSQNVQKNAVSDEEKQPLKEIEGSRRKKDNTSTRNTGLGRDITMGDRQAADTLAPGDAMQVVAAAGLRQVWKDWVALCGLRPVTQRVQLRQWADWVQEGRADALRAEAQRITEAGSYEHPFAGLKASMKKHATEQANSGAAAAQVRAAFGEPTCRPGERRVAPDGQVWTVEAVEYGMVFFAEGHAPQDVPDHVAAGWAVVA